MLREFAEEETHRLLHLGFQIEGETKPASYSIAPLHGPVALGKLSTVKTPRGGNCLLGLPLLHIGLTITVPGSEPLLHLYVSL